MTISNQTVALGIDDAKIFQLSTDTSSSLTYASAIALPALQKLEIASQVTEKALKSDEKVLDYYVNTDFISWAFYSTKISLEALAVLEGGTLTLSGTTPNQTYTYSTTKNSMPNYFKLEAKANYTAGANGDFHLKMYKCKVNSIDILHLASDYAIVTATGVAIPTTNNGKIKDNVINETATAIS